MKRHHKERMRIVLACVVGIAVVLLIERMNRRVAPNVASIPPAANVQLAKVTGPVSDVGWTNAPWEWSARPTKMYKVQQVRTDRSASVPDTIPLRPRQFDLIDFRHQPSVTVDLGK